MEDFWQYKKVLITGGTGFLGKHLADALLQRKADIHIIDFRKPTNEISGGNFTEADIRDRDKVLDLCKGMDIVFHLAALPSIARGKFREYYAVNVLGTKNILEAAYISKVKKFVYVSSSTVYGIPEEFPLKETSKVHPLGKYSRTKLEAENLCREFIKRGLNVSIIRPRVIIGPGRIGIFSILFDRIRSNKTVYIIGKGDNLFQFTNVFDMASACIKVAEYQDPDLFNIGCEDLLPVKEELSRLIIYAQSKSKILCLPATITKSVLKGLSFIGIAPLVNEQFAIADKNFKLDTKYSQQKLGWSPRYSNLDSLIQAYDWYAANIDNNSKQYRNLLGILGKFKHSQMGGFQQS